MFSYICFLVFEVFQVFHLLHLAAVGGWLPAANFTLVNLSDKLNLKRRDVALSNFNICCTWKSIKKSKSELPDRPYSVSDI